MSAATAPAGEVASSRGWHPSDVEALLVGAVAALAGLAAGLAACSPVGRQPADALVTVLAAAGLTALGARAHPGAIALAGGWALAAGGAPVPMACGAVAAVGGVLVLLRDRRAVVVDPARGRGLASSVLGAALTGVAAQGLLRLELDAPARVTAGIAAIAALPVVLSGLRGSGAATRRWVGRGALALGAVVLVTGAAGAVAALSASSSIESGVDATDAGLDAVRAGDQAAAEARFAEGAASLTEARQRLDAWWVQPARQIPVVAQQLAALEAIADGGARTATVAIDGTREVDLDALRLRDGRIDPEAVADLAPLLRGVEAETAAVGEGLAERDLASAWLLPPVADGLARFTDEIADAQGSARTGVMAAELGPALLGQDGVARYMVAFVTPSEARGTGFLGNYGILTVTDGQVELETVGRNKDLNAGGDGERTISGPPDYLARYSRFAPEETWENVTFTPDWPSAGQVMAELLPQSGGPEVDGVLRIDPTGLARLLRLTGPVQVPGLPEPLDATNVETFLELEQYRLFSVRDERIDLLGDVAEATFEALVTGEGPSPTRLARVLGPAVAGGNLSLWLRDPVAQELVDRLGATGAVPPVAGDGFGVVTQNAGGNKIDAFLQRTIRYSAVVDARTGEVSATAEVGLRNLAPSSGEPPYVIGNLVGAPPGTNRMWLSAYSPLALASATLDGEPVRLEPGRERGRNVWSTFLDVPPGGTVNLTLRLTGGVDLASGTYRFDWLPQTMVRADRVDVSVQVRGGSASALPASPAPPGGVETVDGGLRAGVAASEGRWVVLGEVRRRGS